MVSGRFVLFGRLIFQRLASRLPYLVSRPCDENRPGAKINVLPGGLKNAGNHKILGDRECQGGTGNNGELASQGG
jgi:hypothetical protein